MPARRSTSLAVLTAAGQLRLALAPACAWHEQVEGRARGAPPCARDAQVRVTDPVRGRAAVCCASHGLALVDLWRSTVPNRRRNVTRVTMAWLPDAPRRLAPGRVPGGRRAA